MRGSGGTDFRWQALPSAPIASSRTDDIWFADADRGWAVNSNGHILHTPDGGQTWQRQASIRGAYLRCVAFANEPRCGRDTTGQLGRASRTAAPLTPARSAAPGTGRPIAPAHVSTMSTLASTDEGIPAAGRWMPASGRGQPWREC